MDDIDDVIVSYTTEETKNVATLRHLDDAKSTPNFSSHETLTSADTIPKAALKTKTKDEFLSIGCSFSSSSSKKRPVVVPNVQLAGLKSGYNYMFQTPFDVIMVLSTTLDQKAALLADSSSDAELSWSPVDSVESEVPIYIYGVVTTSGDENLKLDPDSILLQGSWFQSRGVTVELDLSDCASFSLFSGQFLAVKGINPTGRKFVVQELLELPLSAKSKVLMSTSRTILIAAGPFTTIDNLDFEPFKRFISKIALTPPDVLILIGPFVPDKHPLVEKNLVNCTLKKMFETLLTRCVLAPLEGVHTKLLISSSPKDVAHDPIYPSAPYDLRQGISTERCQFVSDPCMIDINGFTLGWTSVDVLLHLSRREISKASSAGRLSRLAGHLLRERSFYPLYPPDEAVSVDVVQAAAFCQMASLPHCLVLPSCLRTFALEASNVCCVNPGYLCKGAAAATYCHLEVFPSLSENVTDFTAAKIDRL